MNKVEVILLDPSSNQCIALCVTNSILLCFNGILRHIMGTNIFCIDLVLEYIYFIYCSALIEWKETTAAACCVPPHREAADRLNGVGMGCTASRLGVQGV